MTDVKADAQRALDCLDLTDLNDDCTAGDVRALCARAKTRFGPVAAVCVWPQFVAAAKTALGTSGIKVATVVAFPRGDDPIADVLKLTEQAVSDGADEIDLVVPYRMLLEGHPENVDARVARVRRAAGEAQVKAIIETGVLVEDALIRQATRLSIDGGAHFVKTSTGKVQTNATPGAARAMLETIRDAERPVGFKAAGGIRTSADAAEYLAIADEVMGPGWARPATFRFGASGVLDALIATLEGKDAPQAGNGY